MNKIQKKGQMAVSDAPSVVLIVGLLFLTLATVALIGNSYGNSIDTDSVVGTVLNETGTVTGTPDVLNQSYRENFRLVAILIQNGTSAEVIPSANYTVLNGNTIVNSTALVYPTARFSYNYTYSIGTVASNVTDDLQSEIANNTSIAGIVLTISLVGIVLSILVGVFLGITNRSNRV